MYQDVVAHNRTRELLNIVDFRMNIRTLMVALRLKRQGKSAPSGRWGTGPYTHVIESRWADAEFGLSAAFPWIVEAQVFLEQGDAFGARDADDG